GVPVLTSSRKPFDERTSRRLARRRRREEYLLQHRVSFEGGIAQVPGQNRLFQGHNVFTATRRGPHENHPAEDRRAIPHHLLRHHSAKRESEDVAVVQSQAVQEIKG